jgi:hypothetical protein
VIAIVVLIKHPFKTISLIFQAAFLVVVILLFLQFAYNSEFNGVSGLSIGTLY